MCSPSAALMGSMQLATSMSAQESQYRMSGIQRGATTSIANDALATDQAILLRKAEEAKTAKVQALLDSNMQAKEMKAIANVQAGESYVSGVSVEAIRDNISRQQGTATVRTDNDYDSLMSTIKDNHDKSLMNFRARMMNLPIVSSPNLLATALNIGAKNVPDSAMEKYDALFD